MYSKKIARQSIGRITHAVSRMLNEMMNLIEDKNYDTTLSYPPFHHLHNSIHQNIGVLFNEVEDILFDECPTDCTKILNTNENAILINLYTRYEDASRMSSSLLSGSYYTPPPNVVISKNINESKVIYVKRNLNNFIYYYRLLKSLASDIYYTYDEFIDTANTLAFIVNNLNNALETHLPMLIPFATSNNDRSFLIVQDWLLFRAIIVGLSKSSKNLFEEIMPRCELGLIGKPKPIQYYDLWRNFPISKYNDNFVVMIRRLMCYKSR
jgi:hypothetical protein